MAKKRKATKRKVPQYVKDLEYMAQLGKAPKKKKRKK